MSHLMSLIIANNINICIFDHWPLWVLIEDRSMTDHYKCWLRTVQWMIYMSADWGPFNDLSLWVLIEDRLVNDHYECSLRTVQWIITMNADWEPFNDWSLWVLIETFQWLITTSADCELFNDYKLPLCLISNSVHLELCRDSRSWTTVSLTTMINHSIMKISSVPSERVNVSVRDLLTVFVPYFVNIAFLFLSILSCVQSWDIHIRLTICIVLPYSYCNIVFL